MKRELIFTLTEEDVHEAVRAYVVEKYGKSIKKKTRLYSELKANWANGFSATIRVK